MSSSAGKDSLVIFDTAIVCAAALNPAGVSNRALCLMDAGMVDVVMSNRLRSEYEETLHRPVFFYRYPLMTEDYIQRTLDRFDRRAERIPNPPITFHYARDPKDEHLINLAIAVRADLLITLDRDLLALAADPSFRAQSPTVVLKPGAFLSEIERQAGKGKNGE